MEKRKLTVFNTSIPESKYFEPPEGNERLERQDATQNRLRILETARRLFSEQGVEGVTMSEIAVEAGVGKGTLYRRFPDKGYLCMALVDRATREFQNQVLQHLGQTTSHHTPFQQLAWFLDQLVGYIEDNSAYLKPAQDAGRALDKTPYYSRPVYQWQHATVLLLLRECTISKASHSEESLNYLADALLAPLQLDLFFYQRHIRGYSPHQITAGLHQLLECVG